MGDTINYMDLIAHAITCKGCWLCRAAVAAGKGTRKGKRHA